jgi:hypothetical protein
LFIRPRFLFLLYDWVSYISPSKAPVLAREPLEDADHGSGSKKPDAPSKITAIKRPEITIIVIATQKLSFISTTP